MNSGSNGEIGSHTGSQNNSSKAEFIALTDKSVKYLKAADKRRVAWFQGLSGFGIRVSPKGTKSFVYKYDFEGRDRWITFGRYPELTLKKALERYNEAALRMERGEDPAKASVIKNEADRAASTIKQLAADYIDLYAKPHKRSWQEDQRILERDVLPIWGNRRAHAISKADVIALLDGIVARGAPVQANRTLSVVRRMFNFAIDRDILETSPCHRVKPPAPETSKDRYLTLDEVRLFWNRLDTAPLDTKTRLALKLTLVSLQRSGEILGIHIRELDLDNAVWIIPKERTKNMQSHLVPLSPLALEIIEALLERIADDGFLFPSTRESSTFKNSVLSNAVRRNLDYFGIPKFTPHDLRRTGSTQLAAFKVPRFDRERLLNHTDRSVGAIYDIYEYQDEKRASLNLWSDIICHTIESDRNVDMRALSKKLKYATYFSD
ncbi:MAG: tyrosine-type recombinase/integrase [Alphaproteobacteria bacterium]|nr:tyrosine-type recombinase/integrase [Alphaproteobacteria bacterium]